MPDPHNQREPTPEEQFALLVKETREARGWSQEELARLVTERTGVTMHQTGIARIEGGRRNIRYNEVVALARVLGILQVRNLAGLQDVDEETERALRTALEQAERQLAEADNAVYKLQIEMEALTSRYVRARNQMTEASELTSRIRLALDQHLRKKEGGDADGQ